MQHNVVYFGSGAKGDALRLLSNFAACDIVVDPAGIPSQAPGQRACWEGLTEPLRFPSTEHVWQAFRATNRATFLRFTSDGDLGRWAPGLFATSKTADPDAAVKKMNFWRKNNMIGIIAKLAANPKHAKKFGFDHPKGGAGGSGDMHYGPTFLTPENERAVWLWLLTLKYTQSAAARAALLATGTQTLVEFDRSAGRRPAHWGGLVDATGTLLGENVMGRYVQHVRDTIR